MNNIVSKAALLDHFKIFSEDIEMNYGSVIENMEESFSAQQLCQAFVNDFWRSEGIANSAFQEPDDHIGKSSTFCVACEKLNLLKTTHAKLYAKNRGGILVQKFIRNGQGDFACITLREILKWMEEQV